MERSENKNQISKSTISPDEIKNKFYKYLASLKKADGSKQLTTESPGGGHGTVTSYVNSLTNLNDVKKKLNLTSIISIYETTNLNILEDLKSKKYSGSNKHFNSALKQYIEFLETEEGKGLIADAKNDGNIEIESKIIKEDAIDDVFAEIENRKERFKIFLRKYKKKDGENLTEKTKQDYAGELSNKKNIEKINKFLSKELRIKNSFYEITNIGKIEEIKNIIKVEINRQSEDGENRLRESLPNYLNKYIEFLETEEGKSLLDKEEIVEPEPEPEPEHNSNDPKQIIYYGAPGSGKSWKVDKIAENRKHIRTTFHPDSDYSTFVGAFKPVLKKKNETDKDSYLTYKFVPQAFAKAYVQAWKDRSKPFYLIIEEINRGNCAQIFGDIFQLLDRENGVSSYSIDVDSDFESYIESELGDNANYVKSICEIAKIAVPADSKDFSYSKIALPKNLYIYATMNTSDQSLFPMDSAFKRRWDWEYVPISFPTDKHWNIIIDEHKYSWADFLKKANEKIQDITNSEDKKLGFFFVKANDDNEISKEQFVSKVLFYLWYEIFKDEDSDSIFVHKTDKGEITAFSFSDLFGDEKEKCLNSILKNLGVEPIVEAIKEAEDNPEASPKTLEE